MNCARDCNASTSAVFENLPIGPLKYLLGLKGVNGFGSSTTGEEVMGNIELKGKVFMVTGSNGDLGFEMSRVLYWRGAHVALVCRNLMRAQEVADRIQAGQREAGGRTAGQVSMWVCDLSCLGSVRRCAASFLASGTPLHGLLNNAAVMAPDRTLTRQGLEMQVGVNHVGHHLLTSLLLPRLVDTARQAPDQGPARVVNISCSFHYFSHRDWGKFKGRGVRLNQSNAFKYDRWQALGGSKVGVCLESLELGRQCAEQGLPVLVLTANPGIFSIAPLRHAIRAHSLVEAGVDYLDRAWGGWPFLKTVQQAAATPLLCCVSEDLRALQGAYLQDCHLAHPSAKARDPNHAAQLWEETEHFLSESDSTFSDMS